MLPVLELLKNDLGIRHAKMDERLNTLIESSLYELINERGIPIDLAQAQDAMLVSDFAAWRHRSRMEDKPALSESLRWRIRNRQVRRRSRGDSE